MHARQPRHLEPMNFIFCFKHHTPDKCKVFLLPKYLDINYQELLRWYLIWSCVILLKSRLFSHTCELCDQNCCIFCQLIYRKSNKLDTSMSSFNNELFSQKWSTFNFLLISFCTMYTDSSVTLPKWHSSYIF